MSYYNEARAHVKALKQMSDDSRRRQERRAEMLEAQNEHPLHALRIDGRSCNIRSSQEQYEAIERMDGLIPWLGGGGGEETLIDRFDARAMLDMYIPPRAQKRPKTDEELELEESVVFESYRDLIPLLQRGLTDEIGISEAERQNVAFRAEARAAATAAAEKATSRSGGGGAHQPEQPDTLAAMGNFGAVHFQYAPDTADGGQGADSGDDSGEDSGSDMDVEEEEGAVVHVAPGSEEIAKGFGIPFFDVLLRRELKKEQGNSYMIRPSRRSKRGKKKQMYRAKRMAGQGLDPYAGKGKVQVSSGPIKQWNFEQRADMALRGNTRSSPEYEAFGSGRGGGDGGDPGGDGNGFQEKVEFITSFDVDDSAGPSGVAPYVEGEDEQPGAAASGRNAPKKGPGAEPKDGIRDALPSGMDPSMEGPVALPVAGSAVRGIRAGDLAELDARKAWERRNRERERSPAAAAAAAAAGIIGRGRGRGRSRSRSRSRSLSSRARRGGRRGRTRTPSRSRSRSPRRRGGSRSRERHRERRSRSRSDSRSRSRKRGRDRERRGGGRGGRRSRSNSKSRSRSRGKGIEGRGGGGGRRSRSESGSRSRSRSRGRRGGGGGGGGGAASEGPRTAAAKAPQSRAEGSASPPPRSLPTSASGGAAPQAPPGSKKETPQERMKRIMAAQLNKQVQKDNLSNTQKKAQEERDRIAREQQQRQAGFRGRRSPPR